MTQLKKILYKRVDSFSLLLLFFAVILFSLFFYLLKIDNNIRHYNHYRQQLQKMGMLNHKMETVFYQKYRYIDYDETSRILKAFQVSITQLEQSQMKQEFGEHIYLDLLTLGKDYQRKEYLLQKFEALNSRLTNSMHTIFDLRKTIEHKMKPGEAKQEELHQVFFILSQILMDMPYDKEALKHLMSKLKKYQKEHAQFKYLYLHMQHFLINVKEMKILLAENKKIDLLSEIRHMINDLSTYYTEIR
ncbi:hypothetical protein, partial [Sulfurovum sp.]|uniref:hypothetical protein n=1 Tax=Sulfurovum sp. TaxID=1969726 RepID=UPI00260E38DF